MRNIVGTAVFGDDFFPRPRELAKLTYVLQNNGHPLLVAPRRVGKTSLLLELLEQAPRSPHHFILLVVQSVESEEEYFQRLYMALLQSEGTDRWLRMSHRTSDFLQKAVNRISSVQVPGDVGMTLNPENQESFRDKFTNLLSKLPLTGSEKIIFMVDEFPDCVKNITETAGEPTAIKFLQVNRELRQSMNLRGKIQFIYTGSIGLGRVVTDLGDISLINDLTLVEVKPLKREEGIQLVGRLLNNAPIQMELPEIDIMVDHAGYLIPYFLQAWFYELVQFCFGEDRYQVDDDMIEKAFEAMLIRDNYFQHWWDRLDRMLKPPESKFAKALLGRISNDIAVSSAQIADLALQYDLENQSSVLKLLTDDGYLVSNNGALQFLSPILKAWWRRYAPT